VATNIQEVVEMWVDEGPEGGYDRADIGTQLRGFSTTQLTPGSSLMMQSIVHNPDFILGTEQSLPEILEVHIHLAFMSKHLSILHS
jgi:hypothetical protein